MRPIKFRAWDVEEKCWIPETDFVIGMDGMLCTWDAQQKRFIEETIEYVLCQFTGLRDRHGKEIYESDRVRWDDGEYVVEWSGEYGWLLKDDRPDYDCPNLYAVSSPKQTRIEILGNIYENANLLEAQ